MEVVWTPQARADREAIYDHIERENPHAALELDEQFGRRAGQLVAHPMIGRAGRVELTRELVVRPNYLLVYDIRGDLIRILRVLRASQRWPPETRESN
ncbi:type II toxin-antitoxin system mRNA interferase toxin, RelE/StbE family [Methylopila sp. M107]|uniref:type II toxin-antitoxin system RelE/ParE family toxin n=1 Tax=Methylopila sp. M107 TaxID=1101190 RepID=UPI0009DBFADA|nr:type II toxin-antitoxin system mRNA interferase toxin, RelE/StbE family [Methylopila sp. M107]